MSSVIWWDNSLRSLCLHWARWFHSLQLILCFYILQIYFLAQAMRYRPMRLKNLIWLWHLELRRVSFLRSIEPFFIQQIVWVAILFHHQLLLSVVNTGWIVNKCIANSPVLINLHVIIDNFCKLSKRFVRILLLDLHLSNKIALLTAEVWRELLFLVIVNNLVYVFK